MRIQKTKQSDWTKSFKLVTDIAEFAKIEQNDTDGPSIKQNVPKKEESGPKQQIIVPKIETCNRITKVKPFAGVPLAYERTFQALNLPKADKYELTQVDHTFLHSHENKFIVDGKKILTQQLMESIIAELELKAGKDPVIPKSKAWLTEYLQKCHKFLLKLENFQLLTEIVYNYWRNRRQILKFPLLRTFWKPNQQEVTYHLAFKVRDREKMKLRRTNRLTEEDGQQILSELNQQFIQNLKICQRILLRQELKLADVSCQFQIFHSNCSLLQNQKPTFFKEITTRQIAMAKQKNREFRLDIQKIKESQEKNNTDLTQPTEDLTIQDVKLSVVQFTSTVISYLAQHNLQYDSFQSSLNLPSQIVNKPKPESKPIEKMEEEEQLKISVNQFNGYLYRKFGQPLETKQQRVYDQNWIEHRQREVNKYYFGSDDQGDCRDIRKNISVSFKKFQQYSKRSE